MEVNIVKTGNRYIGEFTVSEDFNLHVEKEAVGYMSLSLRTTETGDYAPLLNAGQAFFNKTVDTDIQSVVYPKHLRIESDVPVSRCVVTYNS